MECAQYFLINSKRGRTKGKENHACLNSKKCNLSENPHFFIQQLVTTPSIIPLIFFLYHLILNIFFIIYIYF